MSSALLNRMVHVHLKVSHRDWLEWARQTDIHPLVIEYVQLRPDHLWSEPPKHEEPFSTPRAWHMLSDALHEFGEGISDAWLEVLAFGCLSPRHATQFKAFVQQVRSKFRLSAILKGETGWPRRNPGRPGCPLLLARILPRTADQGTARGEGRAERRQVNLPHRAKALLKDLATISLEIAQLVVAREEDGTALPGWFLVRSCATCHAWWSARVSRKRKSGGSRDQTPFELASAALCVSIRSSHR